MLGDKLASEARERQEAGLKKGVQIPVVSKVDTTGEKGKTRDKIAAIAKVPRRIAEQAWRAHNNGKAAKQKTPKPPKVVSAREATQEKHAQR